MLRIQNGTLIMSKVFIDGVEGRKLKGFSRYVFLKNGQIWDIVDNKYLYRVDRNDYCKHVFRDDSGQKHSKGHHRLICYAWHGAPPKDLAGRIVVNHLNGIKNDNRPENLEWTNDFGNIEHAGILGLTPKSVPMMVRNPQTGEVWKFASSAAAGRQFGLHKDEVTHRVEFGEDRLFPEGLQYRKGWSDEPWREPTRFDFASKKPILVYDAKEKKELRFESVIDFCRTYDISVNVVATRIYKKTNMKVLLDYRFFHKWVDDPTPWPEVKDVLLMHGLHQPIVTVDVKTGKTTIFARAIDCAITMNLLPTTLNMRLKSGKKGHVWPDGHQYYYFKDYKDIVETTKSKS